MCFGSSNKGAERAAEETRRREAERASRISQGQKSINDALAGFDDTFYAGREKAYLDFALPQINDQFTDARKTLLLALSRSGIGKSSEAVDRMSKLTQDLERQKLNAADQARATATEARKNVEATRGDLYQQLFASADPEGAATSAAASAATLSAPQTFSQIGQLFQNAAAGVGAYRAGEDRRQINDLLTNLAPPTGRSSSVRVVT